MEKINIKAKKVSSHQLRKVLPIYAKSKGLLAGLIVILLIGGIFGIFQPIASATALSNLASQNYSQALRFAVIMCLLGLVSVLLNGIREALFVRINSRTIMELTKKIIDAINSTEMKKLDNTKIGYLSERFSSDVRAVSDSYLDMMNLFFDILTNVVFFCYIAYLNVYIFLILLAYVVILYVLCTIKNRIFIRGRKITRRAFDEARSSYYEQISGMRDIKLLNLKQNITNYSNEKFDNALQTDIGVSDKRNIMLRSQETFSIIFELIFLAIGITFIKSGLILLTGLLVIYTYYGRVERLINVLSRYKEFKADGEISACRIFELIDDFEKEKFGTETLNDFSGKIELKNVDFSYDGNVEVLKNVNMQFEPGKMTAIVGKSGSGKTSILNVLTKLYDVSGGSVLLDGVNIATLTEQSIRSSIGEISQFPYIFNNTIRQNLLFAKPDATEDELINVLRQAQIYDDIKHFPKGLDSEIGENGIKISGGQKQRIAIARLLLRNPKVIVFDEATSALDNNSQKKIVELLDSFKSQKTIIIVAHRLSTIIGADKIYMIDEGRVIAEGTHTQLMKNCKKYSELYKMEEKNSKPATTPATSE